MELREHFKGVNDIYNELFDYINTLPCFHTGYFHATEKLISLAKEHGFLEKKKMLELCCGQGNSIIYLAKKYHFEITGVDINQKQIIRCNDKILEEGISDRCACVCKNVLDLTPEIGMFDIIWSEDSFSHIPDKKKLLKICFNLLNTDGLLIFTDLVKTKLISNKEEKGQQVAWNLWELETFERYKKLIQKAGFKICSKLSNIGQELVFLHVETNKKANNSNLETSPFYINSNGDKLIKEWGIREFEEREERLRAFQYLESGKLDYVFFVATKKE
ncbi:MAG: methyltransferase domain-containing protein [Chitinophagaceae bacterium]|nr:methyltransferase domain-containing protein [Chitinophagaceae bacterium]